MVDAKNVGEKSRQEHEINLKCRKQLSLTGVKEIISFDDNAVTLSSVCGDMTIEGEGLHISVLDVEKGLVTLDGKVNSIFYFETQSTDRKGLLSRIFK